MSGTDFKILVVDDNENNRFTLTERLRRQGYTNIAVAEGGKRALEIIRDGPCDLVLLDVMMPDLDGQQVLERMKADAALRHVPVIMVSAIEDIDIVANCIRMGAEDFLTKPFNPTLLQARVGASLEKKRLRDLEQAYLASFDILTGLPNRAQFLQRLGGVIRRHQRTNEIFAVLRVDLDRFNTVIESLGRAAGDELLVAQARRIVECLPTDDVVTRLDGCQFAILLQDLKHITDAVCLASFVQREVATPMTVHEHEVNSTATVGIAFSTTGYESPDDMLRDADLAAIRAASAGNNRFEVFDRDLHAEALELLKLEAELRKALGRGELSLVYQPIVSLATRRIEGFEALLRWQHPEHGLIPPSKFIPLAEETGLIVPMGAWALEEACSQTVNWQRDFGENDVTISVNVSSRQFAEPTLVARIGNVLDKTGLQGQHLKVEVTESLLLDDPERAEATLHELGVCGIGRSIDDFGTGYSSLSYLQRFPFNTLKIDQTFVRSLSSDETTEEIVRLVIMLAHSLGMDVVAEGVETSEEADILTRHGAEYGQGYFFARPMGAESAGALLAQQQASRGTVLRRDAGVAVGGP